MVDELGGFVEGFDSWYDDAPWIWVLASTLSGAALVCSQEEEWACWTLQCEELSWSAHSMLSLLCDSVLLATRSTIRHHDSDMCWLVSNTFIHMCLNTAGELSNPKMSPHLSLSPSNDDHCRCSCLAT